MPTVSRRVPRADVLLHRGADERIGVRWSQDRQDGAGYVPVDMRDWSAALALSCHGEEVLSVPPSPGTRRRACPEPRAASGASTPTAPRASAS